MTPRASQGVATVFSKSVADSINHIVGMSGVPVSTLLEDAGISRNYYYKRLRYEMPFNTNDISKLAQALDTSPDHIIATALDIMKRNYTITNPVGQMDESATFQGYADNKNVIVGRFGENVLPEPEQAVAWDDDSDDGYDLDQ